ncbi:hypothetical protein DOTSEDRAFT_38414 [Dothistroma septosporum NZE10]|uniref:Uncharacterized protein n=1 Tax=Dothistroma septosporum (strain NZE10 / CBS 128990) TaxID=675120 RepID=M2WJN4_DOTSN|nr:hypothetical protein DOTSEDRAFT_38414 [Dothistroma septosporum NZE10]
MHPTKAVLTLLGSSQLAWTMALEKTPLLEKIPGLDKRSGCPNGGYLLYSTPAGPTCITALGLGIAAAITVPTQALIISSVKAVWTSNMPVAVSASVPAPSKKRDVVPQISARDVTVNSYTVEGISGYDSHDAENPDSDSDWASIIQSIIQYMDDEQIECLQSIVYGDATSYENRITVWINASDGANHRSC